MSFEDRKLVHINIAFRFYIDLPLYKDLYETNFILVMETILTDNISEI